jgi:type II secretory pathway pseudopilin PulG
MTSNERGFTLAGALTIIAVLLIFLTLAIPLWQRVKQRGDEEELVFRGKEYVEAITRYQQKYHTYPPDLDTLVKLKMIRHLYKDPMTKTGKWKVLHPEDLVQTGAAGTINNPGQTGGGKETTNLGKVEDEDDDEDKKKAEGDEEPEVDSVGPVVGVASRSLKQSIRIYQGETVYNKWRFMIGVAQTPQGQAVGPGQQGQQGQKPAPPKSGGQQSQPN